MVEKAPCHNCIHKDTCDILKIYQVVVYGCICPEYKPAPKATPEKR